MNRLLKYTKHKTKDMQNKVYVRHQYIFKISEQVTNLSLTFLTWVKIC